jgi:hypothetical protein
MPLKRPEAPLASVVVRSPSHRLAKCYDPASGTSDQMSLPTSQRFLSFISADCELRSEQTRMSCAVNDCTGVRISLSPTRDVSGCGCCPEILCISRKVREIFPRFRRRR